MNPAQQQKAVLAYVLLLFLASIFGMSFVLTKVAVAEVPPVTIVSGRLFIGALILCVAAYWSGDDFRCLAKHWPAIFVAGFVGNALPFFLISWGQQRVDAGLTSILMAVMPLITLVLAHFFTKDEKLNGFKLFGFLCGLTGVAVLIGFDKILELGEETIRQFAIMGGALCYAINAIVTKYITGTPRYSTAALVLVCAAVFVMPVSLYFDQPWTLEVSAPAIWSIVLLGVFPTALALLFIFVIINLQGAAFMAQINFLVPVFGILFSVLLLGEALSPNAVFALLIIFAGVAIARIKPKSKLVETTQ